MAAVNPLNPLNPLLKNVAAVNSVNLFLLGWCTSWLVHLRQVHPLEIVSVKSVVKKVAAGIRLIRLIRC